MLIRWLPQCLVLALFLLPAGARAQIVEEGETESIKSTAKPAQPERPPDLPEVAKLIVRNTNEFRQKEGLREVKRNPKLDETAQYFANYMARTDKYGHHADGSRPAERAAKHDYNYCIVSENIAYQYDSAGFATEELARQFFREWKHSPGHRKNMLDPDVAETGIAVAWSDQTGYYYAVQMFGRPKSKMIEFHVTNNSDAVIQYEIAGRTSPLPPRVTRTHSRCRPAELTVQWPTEQDRTTVQPDSGDHYTVVRDDAGFRLKRE